MHRKTRTNLVPPITGFATAAMALWCGLGQPAAAQNAPAKTDASKTVGYVEMSGNLSTKNTDPNKVATAVQNNNDVDLQPPISCKVDGKGVLTACRINVGYNLNDVANWFQNDHDRILHLVVDSVTLAKKFERSSQSCEDEKAKK
jgi:hypothetical protein